MRERASYIYNLKIKIRNITEEEKKTKQIDKKKLRIK